MDKLLLKIPFINKEYNKNIKEFIFSLPKPKYYFDEMPHHGLSTEECFEIAKYYSNIIKKNVENKHFTGTIYNTTNSDVSYDGLPMTIEGLYMYIYQQSYFWNQMHDKEFNYTYSISDQVGKMVAKSLGFNKDILNMMTTGGTQSIMTSARAYMNYGIEKKGLSRNKCVIIAPDTIHASLLKAQQAYGFRLVLVSTENGHINMNTFMDEVDKWNTNIVAIYCSYPSYSYGIVDDVFTLSELAQQYNAGFHVDCCLGGFVFNFLDTDIKHNFVSLVNDYYVTSVSIDPHKNGLCPKGVSLLLCDDSIISVPYYSTYTAPDWTGGLYGSLKDEGSMSFVSFFTTYITLLHYGQSSYENTANNIYTVTNYIKNRIAKLCIKVYNSKCINVISFKPLNDDKQIYNFVDIMNNNGYNLTITRGNNVQLCITKRFIDDETNPYRFIRAFEKALVESEQIDNNNSFIRLYSSANIALNPSNGGWMKYIGYKIFGKMAIAESIKQHYISLLKPTYT